MPFLSSKKNLFLFSDKKSSEILPENIAEKFDVITVSSDLKLLENFETFFESLEETAFSIIRSSNTKSLRTNSLNGLIKLLFL